MKKELDDKLVIDFPQLFKDRHAPMDRTCMRWGFECGDGWEPLIRQASEQIEALNRLLTVKFIAVQVKEKYGTLRFYVNGIGGPFGDIVELIIAEAERKSAITCESCGKRGRLRGAGWLSIRCLKCWRARTSNNSRGDK